MERKRRHKVCAQVLRRLGVLVAIITAVSLTGCITFLTEVKVRGDGSGTMVQTMTINPEQMKEVAEGVAKEMGATVTEPKEEKKEASAKASDEALFSEAELKEKALDLGEGVTFVSAQKIDTKTAAGVRVTYAFKDITKLSVNPKPAAAMGTAGAGASSQDALKFRFTRVPEGNATLAIVLPDSKAEPAKEKEKEKEAATPSQASPQDSSEATALLKQMFKGLRMGLSVEVEGKVVKTNSPYVEGSKVTLMDIDFDRLLADEEALKALSAKMDMASGDDRKTMEAMKGIKGLKIVTDPEVTIEFAPK